jgi:hypothetical protein
MISNYNPKPRASNDQARCRFGVNIIFSENTFAADPANSIFEKVMGGGEHSPDLDFFVTFFIKEKS